MPPTQNTHHVTLGLDVTQLEDVAGVNSSHFTGEETEVQGKCVMGLHSAA